MTVGKKNNAYTILAPGFAKWWGSDPRALAQSFRKLGHTLLEIDAEDYVPWKWSGIKTRIARRILLKILIDDYNNDIVNQAKNSYYDFALVFKGMHLRPHTLEQLRLIGKPVYNFYPDVSFVDHSPLIPKSLQYYDSVFTTKTFHGNCEINKFKIKELVYVRHGFDPEVHRPVKLSSTQMEFYGCDVSFVGCWSPQKEQSILTILKNRKNLKVHVYGIGWKYASKDFKQLLGNNLRHGAFGDELAIIYNASKINLGLLSKAQSNPLISDKTTARTFQITGSGSVMLHEDTEEVRSYFDPDREIIVFKGDSDLLNKIDLLMNNESLRESLKIQGRFRSLNNRYDYSLAANKIVEKYESSRL